MKIFLKITIIEINYITFTFVLIKIKANNAIYDDKRKRFIFSCIEQTIINLNILI